MVQELFCEQGVQWQVLRLPSPFVRFITHCILLARKYARKKYTHTYRSVDGVAMITIFRMILSKYTRKVWKLINASEQFKTRVPCEFVRVSAEWMRWYNHCVMRKRVSNVPQSLIDNTEASS